MRNAFAGLFMLAPTLASAQWCPALGPEQIPNATTAEATLAGPSEPGERMIVSGIVRAADGKSPAADVIIYAYHTNAKGLYARDAGAIGLAARHGRLRGYVRTGVDGRYTLRTIRPAPYPGRVEVEHIHLEVMPPGEFACEIDAVEFSDDPLMTSERRAKRRGYGGPGIVTPVKAPDGSWRVVRDIRLWPASHADTMWLDTDSTRVHWIGTKFGGRGKHEGDIRVKPGVVVLGGAEMIAGTITIPITSLDITDIPAWEPVPRNRLRTHLLSAAFFDADRFPDATLQLLRASRTRPGTLQVKALLTIRDATRPITFDARLDVAPEAGVAATAYFRINRQLWDLSYRGSQLGNDLVDDDITFRIRLVARRHGF